MTSFLKNKPKKQTICVDPNCVNDVGIFGPYYILYIGQCLTNTDFNNDKKNQLTNFIEEWDKAYVKQALVKSKLIKTVKDLRKQIQYNVIKNAREVWLEKAQQKGLDEWINFVKSNLKKRLKAKQQSKEQYDNNMELLKEFENRKQWQTVKGFQQAAEKFETTETNKKNKKKGKDVELKDKCEANTKKQKDKIKKCKETKGESATCRNIKTRKGRISRSECCIPLLDTKGNIEDWGCGKDWLSAEKNKIKFKEWVRKFYTENTVTIDNYNDNKPMSFAKFLDNKKLREKYLKKENLDLIMHAYIYVSSESLMTKPSDKSNRNTMSDQSKTQGMRLLEHELKGKFKNQTNIKYHYEMRVVAISQRAWNIKNKLQLKF